jgi:threonine dehydrogenase-like Zn-dependent dehydrogenase
MKAGQIIAPELIEIVEAERPDLALEKSDPSALKDKVLVRTVNAAVCGSDHLLFMGNGTYPAPVGMSLHESIGIIERSWTDGCKEGDLVLALPTSSNAMAEYFMGLGPSVVPLPDGVPQEQLLMAQPLGTVIYCLKRLGHWFNAEVAIVGQGPMGLLFTTMMRNMGASLIIGIDQHDNRLEAAKQMGATHTVNISDTDAIEAVTEITGGRLADLVIEVVGEEDSFNLCIQLARRKGHFINFGVPRKTQYTADIFELFRRNLQLTTSVGPDIHIDFKSAMQMIGEKRVDLAPMISHKLPFARSQEAFELATKRKGECIKIVVDFEEKKIVR